MLFAFFEVFAHLICLKKLREIYYKNLKRTKRHLVREQQKKNYYGMPFDISDRAFY
jgi:hypothetical protein